MPVKYGVTAAELFHALGVNLTGLSCADLQNGLAHHRLALVHQPDHLPAAEGLIEYREDLGKRPPVASLELLWTAHQGDHLLVSGFVHPPTEARAWDALALAGEKEIATVKGLEGSTDLPTGRACVTALVRQSRNDRLILHPRDHDCFGPDPVWESLDHWRDQAFAALEGEGELRRGLEWNAGVYLWFMGSEASLHAGLERPGAASPGCRPCPAGAMADVAFRSPSGRRRRPGSLLITHGCQGCFLAMHPRPR